MIVNPRSGVMAGEFASSQNNKNVVRGCYPRLQKAALVWRSTESGNFGSAHEIF